MSIVGIGESSLEKQNKTIYLFIREIKILLIDVLGPNDIIVEYEKFSRMYNRVNYTVLKTTCTKQPPVVKDHFCHCRRVLR